MIQELSSSETAYKLHTQLLETIVFSKRSFVVIGKILYRLRENNLYQSAVGSGADNWIDYLAQPEIGLSKGEASRLIQIYEQFIVRFGFSEDFIAEVPLKNIHYILPIVKGMADDADVDTLVDNARVLSQKDLKERVFDIRTDDGGERTYEYVVFKRCVETGTMVKIHDLESEIIKHKLKLN